MTVTINASPTNGIVQTADGSGVMKLQSNGVTTNALAWVNFNGTGTVAIRSSYNVSSITDNGTGDYTVNFANALSDANYSAVLTGGYTSAYNHYTAPAISNSTAPTTTTLRIYNAVPFTPWISDSTYVNVAIFGN
jgi:hypothetical protein